MVPRSTEAERNASVSVPEPYKAPTFWQLSAAAFKGAGKGLTVLADDFSFGWIDSLHGRANYLRDDARRSTDKSFQVGYGASTVSRNAAYAAVGGAVVSGVSSTAVAQTYVLPYVASGTVGGQVLGYAQTGLTVAGAAGAGVSGYMAVDAYRRGDYEAATVNVGNTVIAGAVTYKAWNLGRIPSTVRYGAHLEGPLPSSVASTFRGGSYTQTTLQAETTLYRAYGGSSPRLGSYWSGIAPQGPLQARMDLALPPGNTAQNIVRVTVPKGTVIYEGFAAPNFGRLGSGSQVFIPRVNPSWVEP